MAHHSKQDVLATIGFILPLLRQLPLIAHQKWLAEIPKEYHARGFNQTHGMFMYNCQVQLAYKMLGALSHLGVHLGWEDGRFIIEVGTNPRVKIALNKVDDDLVPANGGSQYYQDWLIDLGEMVYVHVVLTHQRSKDGQEITAIDLIAPDGKNKPIWVHRMLDQEATEIVAFPKLASQNVAAPETAAEQAQSNATPKKPQEDEKKEDQAADGTQS